MTMSASDVALIEDADWRAAVYLQATQSLRAFPSEADLAELARFEEPFPEHGLGAETTIALLDQVGSRNTAVSNGPHYYGSVLGGALPAASAAERLMLAWDQCASSFDSAPGAATIEAVAGR